MNTQKALRTDQGIYCKNYEDIYSAFIFSITPLAEILSATSGSLYNEHDVYSMAFKMCTEDQSLLRASYVHLTHLIFFSPSTPWRVT